MLFFVCKEMESVLQGNVIYVTIVLQYGGMAVRKECRVACRQ